MKEFFYEQKGEYIYINGIRNKKAKNIKILSFFSDNEKIIINEGAFKNLHELTDLYISKNVVQIGKNAFLNCNKLNNIVFEESCNPIFNETIFNKCFNVSHVTLGTNLISKLRYFFDNRLIYKYHNSNFQTLDDGITYPTKFSKLDSEISAYDGIYSCFMPCSLHTISFYLSSDSINLSGDLNMLKHLKTVELLYSTNKMSLIPTGKNLHLDYIGFPDTTTLIDVTDFTSVNIKDIHLTCVKEWPRELIFENSEYNSLIIDCLCEPINKLSMSYVIINNQFIIKPNINSLWFWNCNFLNSKICIDDNVKKLEIFKSFFKELQVSYRIKEQSFHKNDFIEYKPRLVEVENKKRYIFKDAHINEINFY